MTPECSRFAVTNLLYLVEYALFTAFHIINLVIRKLINYNPKTRFMIIAMRSKISYNIDNVLKKQHFKLLNTYFLHFKFMLIVHK